MALKETLEVFDAAEAECDAVLAACADGKLTILDLRYELPVIPKLKEAFVGLDKVRGELTEAIQDPQQLAALFEKAVTVGTKAAEAIAAVAAVAGKGAA